MPAAVNLLLAALHAWGVAICVYTLVQIGLYWILMRLLLERIPGLHLIDGNVSTAILFLSIAALGVRGVVKAGRCIGSWRRGEAIPDAAVQLRIALYAAMGCLLICVFLLSTPESFSGPFRVRHVVWAWIVASFAYGSWGGLARLRHRLSARTRHRLDLVGMNVTIAFVLAEVVLRIAASVWANPLLVTDDSPSRIRRDAERKRPGQLWFSFPVNSGGHYDTEFVPPDQRTKPLVVNIGDSFSYGTVPLPYHYTSVAERIFPGADVYNMGYPGLGPADYRYLLVEEALPLEPDLIVIALFVGNDIFALDQGENPARWHDADSYLVGVLWHRLRLLREADSQNWTSEGAGVAPEDLEREYPWLADPMVEKPSLGEVVFLDLETRNANAISGGAISGIYEQFFAIIHSIEEVAAETPVAFLVIPDEFQVEDPLWDAVVAHTEIPLDRDLPQRRIAEWARAGRRQILDVLPQLRAVEPLADGRRHLYHLRDTHFNARGNEVTGRAYAAFVEARLAEIVRQPSSVVLPLRVAFGEPASREWMESGWSYDEPGHVWSEGSRSTLRIPLRTSTDLVLHVECMPFEFPGAPQQRISVFANGEPVGEIAMEPGRTDYELVLPRSALGRRTDTIEFRYAYTRTPQQVLDGSDDERPLAIAWRSLELRAQTER